jgi:hypothetical protein
METPEEAVSRPLASYDQRAKLRDLRDGGWCAFEGALDPDESRKAEDLLKSHVDGLDPRRLAGFGATIFGLAAREPRLARILRGSFVLPFLERALDSSASFKRTGARMSGTTSQARILWHHHDGWGSETLARRERFERLVFIAYLAGTDRAHGPLIIKPRAFSDPFEEAPEARFEPLEDEVTLEYPRGTVVVMDAPVLHSALRGTHEDLRIICGSHVQSTQVRKSHPEDDPPLELVRVGLRHRLFRFGIRNGRKWLDAANRAPLPATSEY